MGWRDELQRRGVDVPDAKAPLPDVSLFDEAERRLKVTFPPSYRAFCLELGPGRLGDLVELWAPSPVRGFFNVPDKLRRRPYTATVTDASNGQSCALDEAAVQIGLLMLGAPPPPRVISGRCAELFFVASSGPPEDYPFYALDRRTPRGEPARMVKLARSFSALILQGFVERRLARMPFVSAPADDQFVPAFYPHEAV